MAKRDFLSITDFTGEEIHEVFDLCLDLKKKTKEKQCPALLENLSLAMVFMKPSLRTRCTFEIGMYQLGGHAVYLAPSDIGMGKRESVYDVARNLERWFDIIMARVFKNETVVELAQHAKIPVINALCDTEHPCQAMADFLTVLEKRGNLEGFKLAYIGDGNNICHSLILLSARVGAHIRVSAPDGYQPDPDIIEKAGKIFADSGGSYEFFSDAHEAVKGVEAIYTDVWASMGQEAEARERKRIFAPYQVNSDLVAKAPSGVMIMHDLPAHRGEEITDEVIDSENSIVFDQAENRLHAQKGIMVFLYRSSS